MKAWYMSSPNVLIVTCGCGAKFTSSAVYKVLKCPICHRTSRSKEVIQNVVQASGAGIVAAQAGRVA